MRANVAFLSTCLVVSACTSMPVSPTLEGTAWRLAKFQSNDNVVGTLRPASPESFTIAFGEDGRLAAKLDCNRGTGPWRAEPGSGGGHVSLGPLATTRMMCPPDPVGDRLARDIELIRSYHVQNGRLYLTLPADAGTYVFESVAP